VQRLDGSGLIFDLKIDLRYSPNPLETMFVNSITKYNDSKNKCLDEYGSENT
jgi:hypothetical protein